MILDQILNFSYSLYTAKEALIEIFSTMFTKNNLETDVYMLYHISTSLQVPFDIVRNHNRVKAITSDVALIKEVLSLPTTKGATLIEEGNDVTTCKIQIRLGQITLILRDIPENTSEENVRNIFSSIEGCPVPQSIKLDINNWFVTFGTEDEAKNALVLVGKQVKARLKSETLPRASAVKNSNRQMGVEAAATSGGDPGSSSSGAQGDVNGSRNQSPNISVVNMGGVGGNPVSGGPPGYGMPMPPMQNFYYQQGARGNPYMVNSPQGYPMMMTPQGQVMPGQYGMPPYAGGREGTGGGKGSRGRGNSGNRQQQQQPGMMMYPGGPVMLGPQGHIMIMQPQGPQPMMIQPGLVPGVSPMLNSSNKQMQQMMYPQQGQQLVNSQGGPGMMTPQQLQMYQQQQYNMQMKQQGQMDGGEGGRKKGEKKQGDGKSGKKGKNKKANTPNVFSQNDFPDTIGSGSNNTNSGAALSGWANAAKGNNVLKDEMSTLQPQQQQPFEQYAQVGQMQQEMLQQQIQQQQVLMPTQVQIMQPPPGGMQIPPMAMQQPSQQVQVPPIPPTQQQQFDAQSQLRAMLSKAPQLPQGQSMAPQFPNHDSSDDIISFGSFDDSISLTSSATLPVQVFAPQGKTKVVSAPVQSIPTVPHNDSSVPQIGGDSSGGSDNYVGNGNVGPNKSNSNSINNKKGNNNASSGDNNTKSAPPTIMWGGKKSFADIVGKR